jgi:hypothetical protein
MPDFASLVENLKCTRDEIRLKIHPGSKEVEDEWSEIEQRWTPSFQVFSCRSQAQ